MKYLKKNFGTLLAAFALFVTTCNVNSACIFVVHQPKVPASALALRKTPHQGEDEQ